MNERKSDLVAKVTAANASTSGSLRSWRPRLGETGGDAGSPMSWLGRNRRPEAKALAAVPLQRGPIFFRSFLVLH